MANITHVHDADIERRNAASPTTLNGDFRDCYIQGGPTGTDRDATHDTTEVFAGVNVYKEDSYDIRGLFLYDLTKFLPADAIITSATLHIYLTQNNASSSMSFELYRLRRTGWKEDEATWNDYKTSTAWGTSGASNTSTDIDTGVAVTLGAITGTGWKSFNITGMVTDAWSNRSGICTFRLHRNDAYPLTVGWLAIAAKNMQPYNADQPHHLRVTYTLAGKTYERIVT